MDYVAVEENTLTTIPENVSFEEASAAPTIALTAWQALLSTATFRQVNVFLSMVVQVV